jgi:hypothetical protein
MVWAYLSGLFAIIYGFAGRTYPVCLDNAQLWFGHTQEIVGVVRRDGGRHRSIRIQLLALVLNRTMIISISEQVKNRICDITNIEQAIGYKYIVINL